MISPGILWAVIGVLLVALYILATTIRDQRRVIEYMEHRLSSLLDFAESQGRDVSDGE